MVHEDMNRLKVSKKVGGDEIESVLCTYFDPVSLPPKSSFIKTKMLRNKRQVNSWKTTYTAFVLFIRIACVFTVFSRTDPFLFSPSLLANNALPPPLSEKLPAVTHVLLFQTAYKVTSRRCRFA